MSKKLGRPTDQRLVVLYNQASELLWYGKLTTTVDRAKEVRKIAEKMLTLGINTYEDKVTVTKQVRKEGAKAASNPEAPRAEKVTVEVTNDGPKKLAARRKMMAVLAPIGEVQGEKEKKAAFKARVRDIKYPLIEKIFNEYAPKYARRNADNNQGGGYTRIIRTGARRGDGADMCIIELV